jgi:hypothetical protein
MPPVYLLQSGLSFLPEFGLLSRHLFERVDGARVTYFAQRFRGGITN